MFYYITTQAVILEINGVAKGLKEELKGKNYNLYTAPTRFDSTDVFYRVSQRVAKAFKKSPYIAKKIKREYLNAFKTLQAEAIDNIDNLMYNDDSSELITDKKAIENFNIDKIEQYTKFTRVYKVLQQEV